VWLLTIEETHAGACFPLQIKREQVSPAGPACYLQLELPVGHCRAQGGQAGLWENGDGGGGGGGGGVGRRGGAGRGHGAESTGSPEQRQQRLPRVVLVRLGGGLPLGYDGLPKTPTAILYCLFVVYLSGVIMS